MRLLHALESKINPNKQVTYAIICDALRALVPFVQFKKREKYPWRSVPFSKVVSLRKISHIFSPFNVMNLEVLKGSHPKLILQIM